MTCSGDLSNVRDLRF